nr:hypothetical protein GTC16762_03630 [Pigmentibacter ruber]
MGAFSAGNKTKERKKAFPSADFFKTIKEVLLTEINWLSEEFNKGNFRF